MISPPGLVIVKDYISEETSRLLIEEFESGFRESKEAKIDSKLARRVVHRGKSYDYGSKKIKTDDALAFGPHGRALADRISADESLRSVVPLGYVFDQQIDNEYTKKQGIAHHLDRVDLFDSVIVSVSNGEFCVLEMIHSKTGQVRRFFVPPRALYVMSGDARFVWKHGISKNVSHVDAKNKSHKRVGVRISNTFRRLLPL
jgi:alkylated DNA repair dioxygenase AlkB